VEAHFAGRAAEMEAFLADLQKGGLDLIDYFKNCETLDIFAGRARAWEVAYIISQHSTGFSAKDLIYLQKISKYLSNNSSDYANLVDNISTAANKRQFVDELEHQHLLVVGDGTFEYSRTVRDKFSDDGLLGEKYDITATELRSQQEVEDLLNSSNNIPPDYQILPTNGPHYTVEFGVDATNLAGHYPPNSQDKIVFNNPRGNGADVDTSTGELIKDVIESSKDVLKTGGELHIGITSSTNALGRDLLGNLLSEGLYQAAGKSFEVRKYRQATNFQAPHNQTNNSLRQGHVCHFCKYTRGQKQLCGLFPDIYLPSPY
jgi:hypothetical protein